jgi:type 1 fimbria pilin
MKKLFAILLAVTMLASMATVVSAAEGTTTLTTTVPAATYTLNIPADQKIEFGALETDIGTVTITNSKGFAYGKNVEVTMQYSEFTSTQTSTTIPFSIMLKPADPSSYKSVTLDSGSTLDFSGRPDGSVYEHTYYRFTSKDTMNTASDEEIKSLYLVVPVNNWGKALAGEYTATITFTAEVVVEQ